MWRLAGALGWRVRTAGAARFALQHDPTAADGIVIAVLPHMHVARLLLIRYGETQASLIAQDPPMTGQSDPPLNQTGRNQARKLGVALCDEPISRVVSSPLQRAFCTARCIADLCGAEVTPVDGLREMDCGELEGEAVSSVRGRLSELWAINDSEADDDFRWPGGESYRDLRQRVMVALEEVAQPCIGRTVAVVTHAGVVAQVLGWVAQLPPRFWKANRPDNGSITELLWGARAARVGRYNVQPEQWTTAEGRELCRTRLKAG